MKTCDCRNFQNPIVILVDDRLKYFENPLCLSRVRISALNRAVLSIFSAAVQATTVA